MLMLDENHNGISSAPSLIYAIRCTYQPRLQKHAWTFKLFHISSHLGGGVLGYIGTLPFSLYLLLPPFHLTSSFLLVSSLCMLCHQHLHSHTIHTLPQSTNLTYACDVATKARKSWWRSEPKRAKHLGRRCRG